MRMRSCDPPSCRTCRGERLSSLGTFALHVRPSLTPFTQPGIWRISPVIHRGYVTGRADNRQPSTGPISEFDYRIWICILVSRSSVRTAYSTCWYARHCHWPHTARRRCSRGGAAGTNHESRRWSLVDLDARRLAASLPFAVAFSCIMKSDASGVRRSTCGTVSSLD